MLEQNLKTALGRHEIVGHVCSCHRVPRGIRLWNILRCILASAYAKRRKRKTPVTPVGFTVILLRNVLSQLYYEKHILKFLDTNYTTEHK